MPGIAITLTDQGRAALVAASGTNAITIAAIGITDAAFTPATDASTLPGEIKRLTTFSGDVPDAYTIHLSIRDESAATYSLRGFGLYLSDGTLFGLYGGGDALIMEKAAGSILLLAVDINFSQSDATSISFGDTNFIDPPATTEVQGIVELATEAEATTGTDARRAVTPKGMLAAVTKWLDDRFGIGAPSVFIKGLLVKTGAADVLTALGIKSAALQETAAFAAASHKHAISDVTNLQASLDAKLTATSYTAADVLAKLQGVDGSGSGMDADMLDGYHAASFLRATGTWMNGFDTYGYAYAFGYNANGGDITFMTKNGALSVMADGDYFAGEGGGFYSGGPTTRIGFYNNGGSAHFDCPIWATSGTINGNLTVNATAGGITVNGSSNDSVGIKLINSNYAAGNYWHICNDSQGGLTFNKNGTDYFFVGRGGSTLAYFGTPLGATRMYAGWDSGVDGSLSCANWFRSSGNTGWYNETYQGGWYMADTIWLRAHNDKSIYTGGRMRADGGFVVTPNEYPVFHSGNDGAGSGMDADTVDGYHASDLTTRAYAGALDGTTRSDAATAWSGDQVRQITTGNALVLFHANWGTGGGPFYAQLYVDGSPWPGAVSEIGATGGSDFVIAPCTIMAVVTGLSAGNHTFAVKRTTGSDLTLYGGGNLVVLPTS
ncbi:MAG: shufflon system plasmid conjugative transfer pilus tip adhesin PilV [Rhizomicrobium sp.]